MTSPTAVTFDPMSPDFRANPYPAYARLRAEAPVQQSPMFGTWTVARYADVTHVLKNPQVFSSSVMGGAMGTGTPVRSVLSSDPPQHTDMRNLVNRAFTPRMVAAMEPRIREITSVLLDVMQQRGGECDLVRDLAIPLPVTVIAEILGVDPERRDDFKRWSNAAVTTIGSGEEGGMQRLANDRSEFYEYFRQKIDERRAAHRRKTSSVPSSPPKKATSASRPKRSSPSRCSSCSPATRPPPTSSATPCSRCSGTPTRWPSCRRTAR
jgi:cytochrome P450